MKNETLSLAFGALFRDQVERARNTSQHDQTAVKMMWRRTAEALEEMFHELFERNVTTGAMLAYAKFKEKGGVLDIQI